MASGKYKKNGNCVGLNGTRSAMNFHSLTVQSCAYTQIMEATEKKIRELRNLFASKFVIVRTAHRLQFFFFTRPQRTKWCTRPWRKKNLKTMRTGQKEESLQHAQSLMRARFLSFLWPVTHSVRWALARLLVIQ